ncbi:carbohydrate ABC transporter permease [Paenibacillus frigoriresistens]|uniref:carbohydrate ABC transporter permease n=1 Tax=Paenibacillus alginolyticus TaxID=59839 RepID=UPI001564F99F|nr:carbohydrate ABC transporter permease [Paenibacillus frigoriresistens]NRF91916.1 carbohydrate ABC transporter permease [Paenibacillus frigoriresistens]
MRVNKVRLAKSDKIFYLINDLILLFALLLVLYPLVYVFSASFSDKLAIISGKVFLWPVNFSWEGYIAVFKDSRIMPAYGNTVFYTAVGTTINVVLTILAAYPLSRKTMVGRNLIMYLFAFSMLFHGGLIPNYLLMKSLGMIDTRWAMLLPGALAVWNMIIARTFFQSTISQELYEAAAMDGCSHIRFIWSIVLPLSKAIIAVMVLFYGVSHWNAYFNAFIYLKNKDLFPLQIVLRDILIQSEIDPTSITDTETMTRKQGLADLLKYSIIIVASLPVWLVYPFVQKHFVKGVMIGSIKG